MAPTLYSYNYPADFPSLVTPSPSAGVLDQTITFESDISTAIDYINVGIAPGVCDIWFVDPLSPGDEATLDALIAAHTGVEVDATIMGSIGFAELEQPVTQDLAWQTVCGILTTPSFFVGDLSELMGRVICQYNGDGGELRIVEEVDGEPDVVMASLAFADSGGSWAKSKLDTGVPPRNGLRNIYRVDARLNGAAGLTLRYGAISMIRVIIL